MFLLKIKNLIYPPKCALCKKVLQKNETDLCHHCRTAGPDFILSKKKISNVAGWTAVWYYKDNARQALIDYKFHNHRVYSHAYGRILAVKLLNEGLEDFDFVTWIPLSFGRLWERGFDQVKKITVTVSRELELPMVRTLRKPINNAPQSSIADAAQRRANVLGAYKVCNKSRIAGKRILLLDDIVTTGSTAAECARMLMSAGAKEVYFAAVAATPDYKR